MKWVHDGTGRFSQRPFYEAEELDAACEDLVSAFLIDKYGVVDYPLSTNDLQILLEHEASDVDFFADLSAEGGDVEGVTEFFPGGTPKVRLERRLMAEDRRENRQRSTMAHELGHVKFHNRLWAEGQLALFPDARGGKWPRCKRGSIIGGSQVDWMEWQAAYASGAYLIPISPLRRLAKSLHDERGGSELSTPSSADGIALIGRVQREFQVSREAARVRLLQRGHLSDNQAIGVLIRAI